MELPMKELIYERVEWVKEKGYWLLIVGLAAATFFTTALCVTGVVMFVLQPEDYRSVAYP